MHSRFLLVPAALVALAPAVSRGDQYLSVDQALATLFPGATFTAHDVILTQSQMDALLKVSDGSSPSWTIRAWRVSTGGWAFLDHVPGRDDDILYVLAVDSDGSVKGVEILECLSKYDGIRSPKWLAQFVGRRQDIKDVAEDVDLISGTSLSSEHIAKGIRRLLITYAMFFAGRR